MSMDYVAEPLVFEAMSVSSRPLLGLGRAVAGVWDGAGDLAPDRAGFSERTKKLGAETLVGRLEAAWSDGREVDDLWLYMERPERSLSADLRLFDKLVFPTTHSAGYSIALSRVDGQWDELADLACRVFVAIDGFVGSIDSGEQHRHQKYLLADAADRGRIWLPPFDRRQYSLHERVLDGIWWLNLYGPAYVERFGRGAFEHSGVVTRWLDNGGVMVQTTDQPVARDDAITSMIGYPHQQPLVDALGADVFYHETTDEPEPGEQVPTLEDHRRAAGTP